MELTKHKTFKIHLIILLVSTFSLFILLFCFSVLTTLNSMKGYTFNKFKSIEATINSEISDAKHIIYGLAASLSYESINKNNSHISNLINNFSLNDAERSIPLGRLVLLDENGIIIDNDTNFDPTKFKKNAYSSCIEEAGKKYFELQVSPIRQGIRVHELIIPLNMAISNAKNQHIGTICSGLLLSEINNKLTLRYALGQYSNDIRLSNLISYLDNSNQYQLNEMNNVFTIKYLLKHSFKKKNIVIHKALVKYPFVIEMEMRPEYLRQALGTNISFYLSCLAIFVVFSYFLWKIIHNYFQNHMQLAYKRLSILNNFIQSTPINPLEDNNLLEDKKLSLKQFSHDINNLIDHCYSMQLNANELAIQQPKLDTKKKILNLLLVERHFLPLKDTATNEEKLYLNKLMNIMDENEKTLPLFKFLEEVASYCCEFYHELDIKMIIYKKDYKNFIFRHTALIETIFHIFTFINRGKFETDGEQIILRGFFANKNLFPTIQIEAKINQDNNHLNASGWTFGPSYVYSGLLSIHLLAKENNLFFNIQQKDNKMVFTLEPMDDSFMNASLTDLEKNI